MSNRLAGFLVATAATLAATASVELAACYSWNLGTASGVDGSVPVDATRRDARRHDTGKERSDATDAGRRPPDARDARSPEPDAHASPDSSSPPSDAARDHQAEAATCSDLEETADAARILAEECPTVEKACTTFVLDRCGCHVFVGAADSGATASYEKVVHAEVEAGCAQDCTPCPTASKCAWCLETPIGSSVGLLCIPCAPPGCTTCP